MLLLLWLFWDEEWEEEGVVVWRWVKEDWIEEWIWSGRLEVGL